MESQLPAGFEEALRVYREHMTDEEAEILKPLFKRMIVDYYQMQNADRRERQIDWFGRTAVEDVLLMLKGLLVQTVLDLNEPDFDPTPA